MTACLASSRRPSRRIVFTRHCLAFVLLSALVWAPPPAGANPWDTFGLGSRGVALNGALGAIVDDWTAVYYNPAGLANSEYSSAGAGYFNVSHSLEIDGAKQDVEGLAGPYFGASMKVGDRLGVGLGMMLPGSVVSLKIMGPDRRRFVMYDNRTRRIMIMGGASLRLSDVVSVGAGFQFLANSPFRTGMLIRLPARNADGTANYSDFDVEMEITPKAVPTFGLQLHPSETIDFGLTYREQIAMELDIVIFATIEFAGFPIDMPLRVRGKVYDTPRQVVGSMSWAPFEELRLSSDVTYTNWSAWTDPRGEVEIENTGGPSSPIGDPLFKDYGPIRFRDTYTPRVGVEYRPYEALALRGGYRFEPSPAPEQSGETNLVDNDKHVLSLGLGVDLDGGSAFFSGPISLGTFVEYTFLPDRRHVKKDPADPVGSYTSGGSVFQFGLDARVRF